MDIDKIHSEWKNIDTVSVFGLGHILKNSLKRLLIYHKIDKIYDNNPSLNGTKYQDIPIELFSEYNVRDGKKILVSTHYEDIKKQLLGAGLQEYSNFLPLDKYLTIMEWRVNKRVYANEIHISITTKCSLQCVKCNMFMPKYKNPTHISIEDIISDVDALFSKVDYVETLALLGGEPLLYPYLAELISRIYDKYGDRYGVMEIITNATITPSDELLSALKNKKIFFRISDYSAALHYEKKLEALSEKLTRMNIPYYVNKSLSWLDFGFPELVWQLFRLLFSTIPAALY